MIPRYRDLLLEAQYEEALQWANRENVELGRFGTCIFARLEGNPNRAESWLVARIDTTYYPVKPFIVGFINPAIPKSEWQDAHPRDPRHWPLSFSPGLHGGFHVGFGGPYRMFWCRECTLEFFYYHEDRAWEASLWRLPRVLGHLQQAVKIAEPPDQWRPLQAGRLRQLAAQRGVALPEAAGTGDL